jgi:Zn-dependent M28 family amino/carboxypeptidase
MSKEEFIYTLYNATEQAFFGGKYYNYHYNYDVSEAYVLAFKNFRGVMNDE